MFDEKFETKKEPLFSTGKYESLLSTFPIKMIKKKGHKSDFLLAPYTVSHSVCGREVIPPSTRLSAEHNNEAFCLGSWTTGVLVSVEVSDNLDKVRITLRVSDI